MNTPTLIAILTVAIAVIVAIVRGGAALVAAVKSWRDEIAGLRAEIAALAAQLKIDRLGAADEIRDRLKDHAETCVNYKPARYRAEGGKHA